MDVVQTDDFREIIRDTFPPQGFKKASLGPVKKWWQVGKVCFFFGGFWGNRLFSGGEPVNFQGSRCSKQT